MIESFVFYRSFHEAIKDFPKDQYGALMYAVIEYALDGIEPELGEWESRLFTLMRPQIDANAKKRRDGSRGGRPTAKTETKTETKPERKAETKTERPAEKTQTAESKPEIPAKTETARFVKPTAEEVKAYAKEKGYKVDVERFIAYYDANGWRVGKNPMKNWKAALQNWAHNGYDNKDKTGAIWGKENEIPDEISDLF